MSDDNTQANRIGKLLRSRVAFSASVAGVSGGPFMLARVIGAKRKPPTKLEDVPL